MSERFDNFQVKVYEALRNAIFEAIHDSKNVKSLIKIIQDHQMLDDLYGYMETLEIRQLIESMAFESPAEPKLLSEHETPADLESALPTVTEERQFIDGRKVSGNEMMFEEYFQTVFDEESWLKELKIRFDGR